jgi:hypothetical protein
MKTVNRIEIKNAQWSNGNDPFEFKCRAAADFVKNELGRRFGNGVTFALSEELQDVLYKLRNAGFEAEPDGFRWDILEPSDYETGKTITLIGEMGGAVRMNIMETTIRDGVKYAKVKYTDRPRKHAIWIKTVSETDYQKTLQDAIYR